MTLKKLSLTELNRPSLEQSLSQPRLPYSLLLDDLRSLHNVGSIFRTADAFLAAHLYLCGHTGTPPHRDIHKAALGAEESVPWSHHPDAGILAANLAANGYLLIALEQTTESQTLQTFDFQQDPKIVFVLGNEVYGVSEPVLAHCHSAVEIPQGGIKHSLNVSVAASLVMWEMYRKSLLF